MLPLRRRRAAHLSFLDSELDTGERPVVFLHGVFDSAACWTGLIGALDPKGRTVAVDARAHGKSSLPDDDFTMATLGRDAASVIETIGRPVALVGHSMGGAIAQQVAVTRPDLVELLVLEDPAWVAAEAAGGDGVPSMIAHRSAQLRAWSRERVLDQGRIDHPLWHADEFDSWLEAKRDVDLAFVEARHEWRADTGADRMADVPAPTLLLTADENLGAVVTEDMAERAGRAMGERLTRVHFPNAGHDIRKDDREGVARTIGEWMSER